MRGMVWFREDLRIDDQKALYHAASTCSDGLAAIYVVDSTQWQRHDMAACRVKFILDGLKQLKLGLNTLNIPLIYWELSKNEKIADLLFNIMDKIHAKLLFFNQQYEIDEWRRDQAVQLYLKTKGIFSQTYDDQTIIPPGEIKNQEGQVYKIFTPYQQAWQRAFGANPPVLLSVPKPLPKITLPPELETVIPDDISGFISPVSKNIWASGEMVAQQKLKQFIQKDLIFYGQRRNFPALDGVSQLSPYLTAGMISPRACFYSALTNNDHLLTTGNENKLIWMTELIWRDYYKHLLAAIPRLSMNKPFDLRTEGLPWKKDEFLWTAWQTGRTGYPIVDAGMRQLKATGWMHNRLRMITAMFLARNLFLDWRWGEKYFMQHLIDGDLSANNGGWQWCAATGADIAPYFRVFNPLRQSERFDPEGEFIRQYCPELNHLNKKEIHDPWQRAPALVQKTDYPKPVIDFNQSRKLFIETFKLMTLKESVLKNQIRH